jgi:tetratricopeptide (TPR) repeat protein
MQNLATILDSQGHLCEAEELLEKSLAIQRDIAGENSPESAVSMNNLGVLLAHLGKLERAQKFLESAVTTRILYYGDEHQLTVCVKRNLDYVKNKRKSLADQPLSEKVGTSA